MKWSAIESAFEIKENKKNREEILTEQTEKLSFNDLAANYIGDVSSDIVSAFTYSKTPLEALEAVFTILTSGDRGIIFGTVLVIISLSLLALVDMDRESVAITDPQ